MLKIKNYNKKEEFINSILNIVFMTKQKFRFKPKNIDYITSEESTYLAGAFEQSKQISVELKELLENLTYEE